MKLNLLKSSLLALSLSAAGSAQAECLLVLPFASASATLSQNNQSLLNSLAARYPTAEVRISGHTDAVGTDTANESLSKSRVASVVRYLRSNGGARMRLNTRHFASRVPIEVTQASSQLNRRVELQIEDCDPAVLGQAPGELAGLIQGGLAGPVAGAGLGVLLFGLLDGSSSSTTTSTN